MSDSRLAKPGRDGRRIFEGGTGSTLPMPCCEDDDLSQSDVNKMITFLSWKYFSRKSFHPNCFIQSVARSTITQSFQIVAYVATLRIYTTNESFSVKKLLTYLKTVVKFWPLVSCLNLDCRIFFVYKPVDL